MTGRNIARYIRVNQLEQPLKERLDAGKLPLVVAVELSYLSAEEQNVVAGLAEQGKVRLDADTAKCLKGIGEEVTERLVLERFAGKKEKVKGDKSIRLSSDVYERYFANVKAADVAGVVEKALAAWFEEGEMAGVSGE